MQEYVQHNDFGAKIGGAKKDLWKQRGLLSGDLAGMNEREAEKYVKKDNVWKKPDYQALIDGGIPVDVAYYIKTIRDSLETAPVYRRTDNTPEMKKARQEQYIETVREVQNTLEGVKSKDDVLAVFDRFMVSGGYFEPTRPGGGTYYSPTEKCRENTTITDKLSRAMLIRSERDYAQKIIYKLEKVQFGVSKESKIPAGYDIRLNDGKHTWSSNNDWMPDTYFVVKGYRILHKNIPTKEEALKWVRDFAGQRSEKGKKRFIPPQLEDVRRDGPDYRDGIDVNGDDYIAVFGFRGGEYGNWMSQNDRQASLNFGYDALMDLADALCICDMDISYRGELSIAFGARGSGNAVAHYEPLRNVINLTKMNGAGSLAHEWWHGLDDFLGSKLNAGGYLSNRPEAYTLMSKLIDTIMYKPETAEQAAARAESSDADLKRKAESWLKYDVLAYVNKSGNEEALAEYERLKTAFLSGEKGTVSKLSELKKRVTGRIIQKEARRRLEYFETSLQRTSEDSTPKISKVRTDFYRASKEMSNVCEKDGGYWDSNIEMTARAFATYILDKLPGRSDYLVGHAECAVGFKTDKDGNTKMIKAYPIGDERVAINTAFDELFAGLKATGLLTHEGRTASANQVSLDIESRKEAI